MRKKRCKRKDPVRMDNSCRSWRIRKGGTGEQTPNGVVRKGSESVGRRVASKAITFFCDLCKRKGSRALEVDIIGEGEC